MESEFEKMQRLACVPVDTKQDKKQLDENVVGLQAINNPFAERERTDYELAFEHFVGEVEDIEEDNNIKEEEEILIPGDNVKYTNPAYHKEFKKDISFWMNIPKNKNIPFEVYIKDNAIGKVISFDKGNGIATVEFEEKYFIPDAINQDKPYEIHTKYLNKL